MDYPYQQMKTKINSQTFRRDSNVWIWLLYRGFGHIGKGYVYNPEFKENIDKFGVGTAQYTSDVIAFYVENQAK